ncbi:hypothetical protein GKG82_14000 [Salmonella enterica]|nr:hypothetical protein [Salmonella enterica]EDR2705927.1 hypothetical protein [Salmonella enterica subsp. enterica serovar Enteritidis]EHN5888667.1 hypothetical protein [Salmonella enterica subsp. enterica serovar Newport]EKR1803016.1 hypothetical protein [Salmonella enterica subsp. enterica serovar Dublin]EEA1388807.1 hypothetical protein [Salmonella enterica]
MENRNEILESFSWAALVAMKMAWRESNITSDFSEHVFIMNWLATARKRKLFPQTIS